MGGYIKTEKDKAKIVSGFGPGFKVRVKENGIYEIIFDNAMPKDMFPIVVATSTGRAKTRRSFAVVSSVSNEGAVIELINYVTLERDGKPVVAMEEGDFHFIAVLPK